MINNTPIKEEEKAAAVDEILESEKSMDIDMLASQFQQNEQELYSHNSMMRYSVFVSNMTQIKKNKKMAKKEKNEKKLKDIENKAKVPEIANYEVIPVRSHFDVYNTNNSQQQEQM